MADRDAHRDKRSGPFDDDDWDADPPDDADDEDAEARRLAAELAALNEDDSPYQAQPASHLFPDFAAGDARAGALGDFDMILDIPVQVSVELGRARLPIRKLLQLAHGSVLELDSLAGEPLDVLVNGTLIAHGEVVVIHDKFGIRLTDIVTPSERMRKIKG